MIMKQPLLAQNRIRISYTIKKSPTLLKIMCDFAFGKFSNAKIFWYDKKNPISML
jgi:hypothetical protein